MASLTVLRRDVCVWHQIGDVPAVEREAFGFVQEDSVPTGKHHKETILRNDDDMDIVRIALYRSDEPCELLPIQHEASCPS